jgi:hypothetical protein
MKTGDLLRPKASMIGQNYLTLSGDGLEVSNDRKIQESDRFLLIGYAPETPNYSRIICVMIVDTGNLGLLFDADVVAWALEC